VGFTLKEFDKRDPGQTDLNPLFQKVTVCNKPEITRKDRGRLTGSGWNGKQGCSPEEGLKKETEKRTSQGHGGGGTSLNKEFPLPEGGPKD